MYAWITSSLKKFDKHSTRWLLLICSFDVLWPKMTRSMPTFSLFSASSNSLTRASSNCFSLASRLRRMTSFSWRSCMSCTAMRRSWIDWRMHRPTSTSSRLSSYHHHNGNLLLRPSMTYDLLDRLKHAQAHQHVLPPLLLPSPQWKPTNTAIDDLWPPGSTEACTGPPARLLASPPVDTTSHHQQQQLEKLPSMKGQDQADRITTPTRAGLLDPESRSEVNFHLTI